MKSPIWEIKLRDKVRKIYLGDIFETFTVAISLMGREIKTNDSIKASPKLKEKYEFYEAILRLVKNKFLYAGEQEGKKKVKLKTVKERKK
jgi:hypothetical protein